MSREERDWCVVVLEDVNWCGGMTPRCRWVVGGDRSVTWEGLKTCAANYCDEDFACREEG